MLLEFLLLFLLRHREKTDKWQERLEIRDETQDTVLEKRDEGGETIDGRQIMKNRT